MKRRMSTDVNGHRMMETEQVSEKRVASTAVSRYIKMMGVQEEKVITWVNSAERILKLNTLLPVDVVEKLRSAMHQAKCLIYGKLRQFEIMCRKNLNDEGKAVCDAPSCDDLGSLWDSISLDIERVGKLFVELKELQQRGWLQMSHTMPSPRPISNPGAVPRVSHKLRVQRLKEAQRLVNMINSFSQLQIHD